jgi:MFS transporter, FHS family, L-fucose permease
MGDEESAARRLNLAQAFNPLGAISGVLAGTVFIVSGVELTPAQVVAKQAEHTYTAYLHTEIMRVVAPYMAIGVFALVWAALIAVSRFPTIAREHEDGNLDHGKFSDLLQHRNFMLAVVAQFLYVGAQVGTWSYFIQYVQDAVHQPEKIAGYFFTGTLLAFSIGRFASSVIMQRVSPATLMVIYSTLNVLLVAIGILLPGWVGLWAIFSTSFFMSIMCPTIFALGIEGLGPNTKIGGSLIVMAIVGGAVLTPIMGYVAQATHKISIAYAVPMLCYVFIALYAITAMRHRSHKQRLAL